MWGVRGRTLSQPQLPALWAGCWGLCGASGVGRSPTPDCPPSGRAAGAGVGRSGSGALPALTARPLGGLPGPVWGVRGRTLSHPRLPALWAGCWGRCGASGVGRSPTPDCPPSQRAAGAGVGRPGWDALPPPTARPLGGLPGPVWGVRGRALSHPRLLALWAGCQGRCGASEVGRSPTPDCPPSGRAAGADVGRPGSDALPPPTASTLGGLPRPVWGVRRRALSHPRLPAFWAGCWGRCRASGVGRSPTPDCSPSGRAAGAGVGRPGLDALPPPTARPLGGLPGPVWGVRGRALSHPQLPALWAGCRGRCGASGVGRSPTPDCQHSGRAAGSGVGRPASGAHPPPTARPLGGLPGPVWGVLSRTLSDPRLPALWAGCRGQCGAPGVGRSPTPDCSPSGRAAGAGVGRPGSDALPAPTACPLGGLPGPVWGVWGWTLSHSRLPALWASCRGRCGASGVGRSPSPDCRPSGRAAGAGVGRPGSDAPPPPTARPLGGLLGPVWGVRGRALSHPRLPALSAGCWGRCGASGGGRSPTPDCPPSGRAAGGSVGRPGSGALPPPTACPLSGLPGPVWGVRNWTVSHHRLPALWAGCRGRCGASRGGRSPTTDCPPSGRAPGSGVGLAGSDALPPPTARPLGGLLGPVWGVRGRALSHPQLPGLRAGCRAAVRVRALLGRVGRAGLPGAFWCASPFIWPFLLRSLLVRPPPGWGSPVCGCCLVFLTLVPPPPLAFFFSLPPPLCALLSPALRVFRPRVPWALASCCPPPSFFVFCFWPSPPPCCLWRFLLSGCLWPLRPPPSFGFFFLSCCFVSCCTSALRVLGCRAVCSLSCPLVVLCASSVLFLVAGVVGSWCRCLLLGVCWWLWLPGVVVWWCVSAPVPVSGLAVAGRPPCGVPFPCAVSCGAVLPCGAVLWYPVFFFFFLFFCFPPCWSGWFPVVPRWFWAPGWFRVVSVSVLCLCGAVLVCLRRCSLFGALVPSRGWLGFCVVACCVCVFAVGPGCPLLCPGGSWWLLVSCLGGVLWCVPGCCAAPCCCALRRLALRCCALCCFVLLCLVLPRAVLCPGALSFVLGSCAFWRRVLSCPPALCVFCCGVSLRGVVRRCALCRVRPGVSCCAFLVVSALCAVAVWPALSQCPASLCCAPWCCAAAWCRGVLSCRLAGFVSCVGVVVPT